MSSIDERIVQMEFDNSLFDKNVESSIKTLEKLNVALKMDGIDKNISDIASSVNKMDFSKVENSITSLQSKFSGLTDFVTKGVTDMGSRISRAISGELDRAVQGTVRYVEKLGKQLIVDPVSDGFKEYELKMGSVQTIMNSSGASLGEVNKYLDELNTYADKTIYSFSDMTSSIGKFTNAGVELEPAVKAIQGISNVAALSGANAQQASHAMYNFAQALSSGSVKLIDWKSIENANMATKDFKNALIETAVQVGTLKKEGDQYVSTTENMQGKTSAAFDAVKGFNDSLQSQWMTTDVLTKTLAKYSNELDPLGQKAFKAATQVKTYSQLIDTLKEAVGSGWAKTFELFIGDFEQARELFTSINDVVGGFIDKTSDARNNLLEQVLGGATKASEDAAEGMEKAGEAADTAAKSFEEYQRIADEVRQGKWDDGQARMEKLTKAGYDYDAVMSIVNHDALGWELNMELINKALEKTAETTKEAADATEDLAEANEKSGRELLIEAFARVANSAITIFRTLGEAWRQVFPPVTAEALKNGIKTFNNFTKELVLNSTTVYKLRNVFKGLLAPLSILFDAVTGLARAVFTPLFNIVTTLGNWLLRILSPIGKFVAGIAKAVHESDIFYKVINGIVQFISPLFESIGKIGDSITKTLAVGLYKAGDAIMSVGGKIKEFWGALKETKGFQRFNSVISSVGQAFGNIKDKAVDRVTKFFDDLGKVKIDIPGLDVSNVADAAGQALDFLAGKIVEARIGINRFFNDIKVNENNPLHGIYTYFSNLSAQGLIDSVSSKLKSAGSSIKRFFKETGIAAKAQETFNTVISNIKETAPQMFQGLLDIFGKIGTSILGAKDKIVEFWGSFKQTQGFQTLKSGIVNIFNNILNAIGKASTGIANFFKSIFGSFKDFKMPEFDMGKLAGTVSEKIEWLKGKFGELKDKVSEIFSGAQGIGGTALETITTFFTNIDLSNGIETISSNLERAKNAISDFFKMLGGLFGAKEVSASPIDNVAESTASLADGLEGEESVLNHFLDIVGKVKDGTNKVWDFVYPILNGMVVLKIGFGIGGFFKKLGGVFGGFTKLMKRVGGTFKSIQNGITRVSKASAKAQESKAILNVAIAIGILAASFFALGQLSLDQFKVAAAGIGVITVALIALMGAFRLFFGSGASYSIGLSPMKQFEKTMAEFGTKMSKALGKFGTAAMILAFAAGITILVGAIKQIGEISGENLLKGVIVIGILGIIITAATSIMSHFSTGIRKGIGTAIVMIAFVAAIKLLVGAVKELGEMDTGTLKKGIVAVVILGVLIGALIKVSKNLKKVKAGPILALAITIGVVAFALYKLTELDTTKLLGAATSLGIVIGAMAALSYALSKMETKNIAASVVSMIGVGALLAEVAYILNMFTSNPDLDADKMLTVSESISLLMGVMGGLTYLSQALGKTGFSGLKASAWGAVDIGVVTGIVSAILALVGLGAGASYDFLGPEMAQTVIDGLDWLGKIFEKVSETLGKMVGGFFGGLLGGALGSFTSELPGIATNLNTFITNLGSLAGDDAPSLSGITTMIDTLRTIAAAAKENVVADIMNNWFNEGEGGSSMGLLGDRLIEFAGKMKEYADKIKGLNVMTILSTSFAIDSVMKFANAVPPQGGWADTILGDSSLGTFATNLIPFAIAMRSYSAIISSFGGINGTAVESSARCGTMLAELNNAIPRNGGLYGLLAGNKDLSTFGDQLKGFGSGLVEFSKAIMADDVMLDPDATKKATAVAGILAEFAKTEIQATDGVLQWLMGTKDIGVFGGQAAEFGTGIVAFANGIKDAPLDTGLTEKAAQCGGILAGLATKLPPEGGALQWLMGEQNLASFGKQLPIFAQGLNSFSLRIAGFKSENVVGVTDSINALMEMLGILHQYGYTSTQTISTDEMSTAISSISNTLNDFATQMSTLETDKALTDIKEAGKKLADDFKAALLAGLEEGSKGPDATFVGPMQQTNYLKNILDSMFGTNAQIETEMAPYGERIAGPLITAISNGMKSDSLNLGDASSTLNMILSTMIGSDDEIASEVKTVGSKIGSALVTAIGNGTKSVEGEGRGPDSAVSGLKKIIDSIFGSGDSVPPEVEEKGKALAKALYSAFQNGINNPEEAIEVVELLKMVVDSLEDGEPDIERAGASAASAYASGVSGNSWAARTAGSSLRTSAVNGASGGYSAMYEAGANVGRGYVAGINSQIDAVRTATARLAAAGQVSTANKDDSHSPSRKYMKLGSYVAMGYAKGIVDNIPIVTDAVESMSVLSVGAATDTLDSGIEEMAKSASKSIAAAYAYINNVASQSLNSSPVITPVLDMSMLQNGMNSANGLWGLNGYNPFGYANSMFPSSAYQYTNGMMANDAYVTQTELRGIRTDLKNLGEAITHMNMVLDSGTLVGQLTPGIDSQLGAISGLKERWA